MVECCILVFILICCTCMDLEYIPQLTKTNECMSVMHGCSTRHERLPNLSCLGFRWARWQKLYMFIRPTGKFQPQVDWTSAQADPICMALQLDILDFFCFEFHPHCSQKKLIIFVKYLDTVMLLLLRHVYLFIPNPSCASFSTLCFCPHFGFL